MIWFALAAVGVAAGFAAVAALSEDSSSSSSTYTTTHKTTISEDNVKTKDDYIDDLIKNAKDVIFNKYKAEVKIDKDGDYEVLYYGDEYEVLTLEEKKLLQEIQELDKIAKSL